jgi:tRNA dimethylallyltransferase
VQPLPSPLLVLVGPTAVGKSAVVAALAARRSLEVVVADSLQVYRGLDVGTAKPTPAERARIPHHLVDLLDPTAPFTAAEFAALARRAVEGIAARGRLPVVAGGTGLYVRAFLRGPLAGPGGDPALRAHLRAEADRLGATGLHARLAAVDPAAAARIHPHNVVRVLRALELYHLAGRPPSALRRWSAGPPPPGVLLAGLRRGRDDLAARIEARTRAMLEAGLLGEVRGLLARGIPRHAKPLGAIGYREMVEHLEGRITLGEAARRMARDTRRYAKRQMTWFRREPGLCWIDLRPETRAGEVAEEILARLEPPEARRASAPGPGDAVRACAGGAR